MMVNKKCKLFLSLFVCFCFRFDFGMCVNESERTLVRAIGVCSAIAIVGKQENPNIQRGRTKTLKIHQTEHIDCVRMKER